MDEVSRFNRYEENFLNSSRIITRAIRSLQFHNDDVGVLISTSVACEGELSEIEGFYKAMEVEVGSMMTAEKQHNQRKLDGYAEELEQATAAFKYVRSTVNQAAQRSETTSANRRALVAANERLDESTTSIQKSQFTVAETEEVGYAIMADLESQKGRLIEAGDNVKETKRFTFTARRTLNLMSNRALMQKVFLMTLISLLFFVIWMLLYYGIILKKK